jgi:hypothetical protein
VGLRAAASFGRVGSPGAGRRKGSTPASAPGCSSYRCTGVAPSGLRFELGVRRGRPPLVRYGPGERLELGPRYGSAPPAACRSTETSFETPFSSMVTP